MANLAVETVLAQLAGQQVPECVVLPSRFVCRRSCGCEYEQHPKTAVAPGKNVDQPPDPDRIEALRPKLERALHAHPEDAALVSRRLIESIRSAAGGQYRAFQKAVGDLLEDLGDDSEHHHLLQDAIEWLHDELSDGSDGEVERTFYEGMTLVATSSTTTQTRQQLRNRRV